jgi:hypothetical protein
MPGENILLSFARQKMSVLPPLFVLVVAGRLGVQNCSRRLYVCKKLKLFKYKIIHPVTDLRGAGSKNREEERRGWGREGGGEGRGQRGDEEGEVERWNGEEGRRGRGGGQGRERGKAPTLTIF